MTINYLVEIRVNLAEVSRLASSKEAYVVWMETEDSEVKISA
jgi:hypothetical protein